MPVGLNEPSTSPFGPMPVRVNLKMSCIVMISPSMPMISVTFLYPSRLSAVESNVFTITVMIGTQDKPRRYYVARSVVWRRGEGDVPRCIPIVPFERLATSAVDMESFAKETDKWAETYSPPN